MLRYCSLIASLCLIVLFSSAPIAARAETTTPADTSERTALLAQIRFLEQEVLRLQTVLARQIANQAAATLAKPHSLVFYQLPFEQIYFVQQGTLVPADRRTGIRTTDAALFSLFTNVLGTTAVEKYVAEWRIFNTEREDLGAFVELIPETGKWVVGVNRAGFGTDQSAQKSFATLFLHEFAHIILFDRKDFTEEYTDEFWTSTDARHARSVATTKLGREKFSFLQAYYDEHSDRFVSDYATLSPDEDLAETFVAFVTEGEERSAGIVADKIAAFYTEPALVTLRGELRSRAPILLE